MTDDDPFRHHPALRPLVTPRSDSFFADFRVEKAAVIGRAQGLPTDWMLSEDQIEVDRAAALSGREARDLWVFGYGSLMWDPAIRFAEVRRGLAPTAERRFILCDTKGARGTPDRPGLMAALDRGAGCHGLVFRIAAQDLTRESRSLWHRERLGPAYFADFIPVQTEQGPVEALAFLADHSAEEIRADLSHADQVRMIATGAGFLGTSRAYLENLAAHFDEMRIADAAVAGLLADVRAYAD